MRRGFIGMLCLAVVAVASMLFFVTRAYSTEALCACPSTYDGPVCQSTLPYLWLLFSHECASYQPCYCKYAGSGPPPAYYCWNDGTCYALWREPFYWLSCPTPGQPHNDCGSSPCCYDGSQVDYDQTFICAERRTCDNTDNPCSGPESTACTYTVTEYYWVHVRWGHHSCNSCEL